MTQHNHLQRGHGGHAPEPGASNRAFEMVPEPGSTADPCGQLRHALRALRAHVETRLENGPALSGARRKRASRVLRTVDRALLGNDALEMMDAGRQAADWVKSIAAADCTSGSPDGGKTASPRAVAAYEEAAVSLAGAKPACVILEAGHQSCRFDPECSHTVFQLAEDYETVPGLSFAPALDIKRPGGWYVARLVREHDRPGAEVIGFLLVAGPFESELAARFQQLHVAPLSIRPEPCAAARLPPNNGDLGALAAPTLGEWGEGWADQHYHAGTAARRDALSGYFSALCGQPDVFAEGRGSQEWRDGWTAGCAARMLGYKGLPLAVQQARHPPRPRFPPLWCVINLLTERPVPSLTDLNTESDARRLARTYGILEAEALEQDSPQDIGTTDPQPGQVYVFFQSGSEQRWSETFGPFEFVQVTNHEIWSPDGEAVLAVYEPESGVWLVADEPAGSPGYTDVVFSADPYGNPGNDRQAGLPDGADPS